MIVICEECGKKYRIDPGIIKGDQAKFKCKTCNHINVVTRAAAPSEPPPTPSPSEETPAMTTDENRQNLGRSEEEQAESNVTPQVSGLKLKGIGLRGKMVFLFLLVPSLLIAAAGVLYLRQLNDLSSLITQQSSKMVNKMAEDAIAGVSRAVAKQCKLYFQGHPGVKKESLNKDVEFRKTAVQKVGQTGYTAFYEIPGVDGVWRTWAHVNPNIVNIDMSKLRGSLGKNFPGFWKVYTGVKQGRESRGYYTWQDKDGTFRKKYMVCTPMEGTPYVVAATTYLDEFTKPVKLLESRAEEQTLNTRNIIFEILGGTLLLIALTTAFYGHRLTGRIKSLTEVADRISIGDLEANVSIDSKDEIGALGEAISRMQDSIRLSIERLRRRR